MRKLAAENGVDLAEVKGTGVGGRIRKQDVLAAAEAKRLPPAPASRSTGSPGRRARYPRRRPLRPWRTLRGTTQKANPDSPDHREEDA